MASFKLIIYFSKPAEVSTEVLKADIHIYENKIRTYDAYGKRPEISDIVEIRASGQKP